MDRMSAPSLTPLRVCFVCTGNICRSPMAESVFRTRVHEAGLGGLVTVDSAGTGAWHEGDGADPRTVAVLTASDYEEDASGHIARQFQPGWFADIDLVVALDNGHLRALRRLAPTARDAARISLLRDYDPEAAKAAGDGCDLDVPDPYYGGTDGFDLCLRMCEAAADGLLDAVRHALHGRGTLLPREPEPA
jgi:protein-tyrosine phosphatase